MTQDELRSHVRRITGFSPPAPGAPREKWRAWFAAAVLAIGLRHHGDREQAIQWTRDRLAECPDGAAYLAVLDQHSNGARSAGVETKTEPMELLLQ
ncbi:hypothetical protein CKO28_18135 [Rhodovibrio sodomensis]|uniref:Uncharacterized protein n=1 Tax=Rhodovibrio sodomensis TaxID=1088 RepID=A0ABS1DHK4_9PROT|nr:hypothetical protein [Rhodovibrio sodomensis]MBK1669957.1 hypothetical protein [Rhodovibrio sodomensis]